MSQEDSISLTRASPLRVNDMKPSFGPTGPLEKALLSSRVKGEEKYYCSSEHDPITAAVQSEMTTQFHSFYFFVRQIRFQFVVELEARDNVEESVEHNLLEPSIISVR